ncbi:MAG: hypothetical protein LBC93_02820 [Synergistaceae bacterium]|jgi:hypothetical protein|nr:hypothetical protein [Synergistaceae bacterium]
MILAAAASEGLCVTARNEREDVDAHQRRGLSFFELGWRWILKQLSQTMQEFAGRLLGTAPYLQH